MAKRKKKNKQYTDEFKREAIGLLATRGDSTVEEIVSSLGVFPSMLYQWRKQFGSEPEQPIGESYEDEARRLRREISQIKKENVTLKSQDCALREGHGSMSTVDMVNLGKSALGVTESCRLLGMSKSSYYDPISRTPERAQRCRALVSRIRAVFEEHLGNYGSPRIHRTLRSQGIRVSCKRVASLMHEYQLVARRKRGFKPQKTDSNHKGSFAPNWLEQDFSAEGQDLKWVGDISVPQQAAREMRDRPLAIGLQGQVANHRKRFRSKALVVRRLLTCRSGWTVWKNDG